MDKENNKKFKAWIKDFNTIIKYINMLSYQNQDYYNNFSNAKYYLSIIYQRLEKEYNIDWKQEAVNFYNKLKEEPKNNLEVAWYLTTENKIPSNYFISYIIYEFNIHCIDIQLLIKRISEEIDLISSQYDELIDFSEKKE